MSKCGCKVEINNKEESKILITLICINLTMFVVELIVGVISESTALIADSLDMLADAAVYGIALYAVGKAIHKKISAAYVSGVLQIALGVIVVLDVVRRFIYGSDPESILMIIVGCIALIANSICLYLISKHKDGEVHMRASWIFSKNDVIANVGIIVGGILVYLVGSRYPDLLIGMLISVVVVRGGIEILRDAKEEQNKVGVNAPNK